MVHAKKGCHLQAAKHLPNSFSVPVHCSLIQFFCLCLAARSHEHTKHLHKLFAGRQPHLPPWCILSPSPFCHGPEALTHSTLVAWYYKDGVIFLCFPLLLVWLPWESPLLPRMSWARLGARLVVSSKVVEQISFLAHRFPKNQKKKQHLAVVSLAAARSSFSLFFFAFCRHFLLSVFFYT